MARQAPYDAAMTEKAHILVVDDHRDIRDGLDKFMSAHGFRVSTAPDGRMMRRLIERSRIDLIVLDLMLPGEDGLSLCRFLRTNSSIPVVMLTAMGEETDRVVGLEMGADDYIAKPFSPRELVARVKAVLRRTQSLPDGLRPPPQTRVRFARWLFDVARRELQTENGTAVPLSTAEYNLLRTFVGHPGRVLSRDQLLDLTQGRTAAPFDRAIDTQVSRLRRKIEVDPKAPEIIKTVWGGGYVFAAEVKAQ
jgi:two-component system OmpR family response regulator